MACVGIKFALDNNNNYNCIFDSKTKTDIDVMDYRNCQASLHELIKGLMLDASQRIIGAISLKYIVVVVVLI